MSSYLIDEKKNLVQPSGMTFTKKTYTFAPGELFVARWDNDTNSSRTDYDDQGKVYAFISSCDLSKFVVGTLFTTNRTGKINTLVYVENNVTIEMTIHPNIVYRYTGYSYGGSFTSYQEYIVAENLRTGIEFILALYQTVSSVLTLYFEE